MTDKIKLSDLRTRERILEKFNGRCAYCGKEIALHHLNIDHYYPKRYKKYYLEVKGYEINTWGNLMPSCFLCNNSKRDLEPDSWFKKFKEVYPTLQVFYFNTLESEVDAWLRKYGYPHPCVKDYTLPKL